MLTKTYFSLTVSMLFLHETRLLGAASALPVVENNQNVEPGANELEHFSTTSKRVSDLYEPGHFIVNPDLCGHDNGANLSLLIMVRSAPKNHNQRIAIRDTWGVYGSRNDISLGFLIGTTNNHSTENSLEDESDLYGDIVRSHFTENYDNLTLKTISVLEWVDVHCSQAEFVFNVDDDMFINVMQLMSFIDDNHSAANQKVIFGHLVKMTPIRRKTKDQKNVLSRKEYSPSRFPSFVVGGAYLISRSAIHDLYMKALTLPYLKLEDVFITGIVAQLMNVKRIFGFEKFNLALNQSIAFDTPFDVCSLRQMISIHGVHPNKMYDLWKKQLDTNIKC
ncbi:beta-1,3-galactosyltransferase 5-like [Sitodiplosis mosellana]|uniref:beta-1,3-galactosyltransferase 5-like n=1 Tax=Sitodiplosis mosellana TaxID=263140 RepID=UPI0024437519|nr:beta-1,3-galactosyltransferase 5-like [Sitodiplosis mosellana]